VGYNTTLGPLNRWSSVLDKIRAGTFQIASSDPKTLAYRLHEALKAAKKNEIEPYASMELTFKTTPGYLKIVSSKDALFTLEADSTAPYEFPAAVTAFDVVQAASGLAEGTLVFPSFDGQNLKMVKTWAKAKGWKTKMKENILTLTLDSKSTNQ